MYDNSGVYIGVEGANKITDKMSEFSQAPNELLDFQRTPESLTIHSEPHVVRKLCI
jgi:hypothetical protein